jgi:hypothetical protein
MLPQMGCRSETPYHPVRAFRLPFDSEMGFPPEFADLLQRMEMLLVKASQMAMAIQKGFAEQGSTAEAMGTPVASGGRPVMAKGLMVRWELVWGWACSSPRRVAREQHEGCGWLADLRA